VSHALVHVHVLVLVLVLVLVDDRSRAELRIAPDR
jgi:hypothetical protein